MDLANERAVKLLMVVMGAFCMLVGIFFLISPDWYFWQTAIQTAMGDPSGAVATNMTAITTIFGLVFIFMGAWFISRFGIFKSE